MTIINPAVKTLSECRFPSPFKYAGRDPSAAVRYRQNHELVRIFSCFNDGDTKADLSGFERAGPREKIFSDPSKMTAAIMTCGGLCPGLNDVIRGLVMSLHHHYGVPRILGIRYGYSGLGPNGLEPMVLRPDDVEAIHLDGGTVLGSSRGKQDVPEMARKLLEWGVDQLYVIGGDGTQKGALALSEEFQRINAPVAVIGIPKTIDNDILWVDQSFGFDTAVEVAAQVIQDAHVEARSAERCIGLVKVMGRESGYIAAHAALASLEANVVLIPEVPFVLEGRGGLVEYLEQRMQEKDHAVLVVAEGAGQELFHENGRSVQYDASGNRLHQNIGALLDQRISDHFRKIGQPVNIKYLDPSYSVRSASACSTDRIYCTRLAHAAVHAAMAGRTEMMVSRWSGRFVHVPLRLVTQGRRKVDPAGSLWRTVLEATGQPCLSGM